MKKIIPIEKLLLKSVEEVLERTRMSKSAFGKLACNDPKIVERLRCGKVVRSDTINAINKYIYELTHTPN